MASGESSLDSNLSGGDESHSRSYLGFSNEATHSASVPREYDQMKQPQMQFSIDPLIEMNQLRSQTEFYRTQTIALKNSLEMILQDKRKLECAIDSFKNDDIDVHALFEQYANCRTELKKLSKEMEICKTLRDKWAEDCKRVSHENDILANELKLINREKDTVLKENQKLSDEFTHAQGQLKIKDNENKSLKIENNCLKQDLKKSNRRIEMLEEQLKMIKSRNEFMTLSSDSWSKDLSETKDNYNDVTEQYEHDMLEANQEIRSLKHALDMANTDLNKAAQEIDMIKKERKELQQQRDSVQAYCNSLQVEKSKAITRYLETIHDNKNIKKQKDEACKEVEQLKEYLGTQIPSNPYDMRLNYLHELDMMQKSTTEIINVDVSHLTRGDCDIGIALDDGRSAQQNNNKTTGNITVLAIYTDSVFYNKLQKDDIILQVNNLDCKNFPKSKVFEEIRSNPHCSIIVRRKKNDKRYIYTAELDLNEDRNHGLSLEGGIFISKISAGSLASTDKILGVGDRILSVNNHSLESVKNLNEVMNYLDDSRLDTLTIVGMKQMAPHLHNVKTTSTQTDIYFDDTFDLEDNHNFAPNQSFDSASSTYTSPSTPSKFSSIFAKFRGIKMNPKSNDTDAAIAVLDSVLKDGTPSNIPTKDNGVVKRSKKKNKENAKESAKSMSTWPRTNPIAHDNNTGTILHHKHKERPKLFDFTESFHPKPTTRDESRDSKYFESNPSNSMTQSCTYSTSKSVHSTIPSPYLFNTSSPPTISNRHSTAMALSTLPRQQKNMELNFNHHQNRLSLNLTPNDSGNSYSPHKSPALSLLKSSTLGHPSSPMVNTQNNLGFSLPKSQHSIESYRSSISPPPHEFSSKLLSKDPISLLSQYRKTQKNSSKYPSDSESLGHDSLNFSDMQFNYHHNRAMSPKVSGFSHFPPNYPQQPLRLSNHPANATNPIETNFGIHYNDKSLFDSYTPGYHSHGTSVDYPELNRLLLAKEIKENNSAFVSGNFRYEGGTFPRKKEHQRLRIPSNQSVTSQGSGIKNSTGSIEHHGSERGSPMSLYHSPSIQVEVLSHGSNSNQRHSMSDYAAGQKPNPGDLRRVTIDKSVEPLGITIRCNNNGGGIFVSTVTENSLASQVGLQIADQLLEVCGINMRAATYEGASRVLRQCGNPITMLVQYSPEKYDGEIMQNSDDQSVGHSESPTPRNSPQYFTSKQFSKPAIQQIAPKASKIPTQIRKLNSDVSSMTDSSTSNSFSNRNSVLIEEPRKLYVDTNKSSNLGIKLLGGNAFGIFVEHVEKDTVSEKAGMRVGDQILEFNGSDLRRTIAEYAAYELAKPAHGKITVIVQNNMEKYNQIKDKPGCDSFFIRAGFDRTAELSDRELRFTKDEVLYVDNTILHRGQWSAWKLDENGTKAIHGIIPSKFKVEEDIRLHGDITEGDSTSRRGSTSARRSFFRRKKHTRSSSKDSKELASFSNTKLSWHSDSGMLTDDTIQSYQQVERVFCPFPRPVLVLGPLADWVVSKLTNDFPQQFKLQPFIKTNFCDIGAVEKMIKSNMIIDYRRHGNTFEVTPLRAIKEIGESNLHCVLDISLSGVERLQRLNILPIVLLLKFKSAKLIKEIKDPRYTSDKITAKAAKEMYEHSMNIFSDYKHMITAVIQAGVNTTHICTQVKDAVEKEQKKVIWVPTPTSLF